MAKKKLSPEKYRRLQERLVINAMLMMVNLPLIKGKTVEVKLRNFGTVHTHRNRKDIGAPRRKKENKALWKAKREKHEFSAKYLLF